MFKNNRFLVFIQMQKCKFQFESEHCKVLKSQYSFPSSAVGLGGFFFQASFWLNWLPLAAEGQFIRSADLERSDLADVKGKREKCKVLDVAGLHHTRRPLPGPLRGVHTRQDPPGQRPRDLEAPENPEELHTHGRRRSTARMRRPVRKGGGVKCQASFSKAMAHASGAPVPYSRHRSAQDVPML